jgi:hypothetical protein
MAEKKRRDSTSKGETAENVAVDTTGTVAKVTGAVVGAAAIGLVKGIGKAVWRGFRPRR